MISYYLIYISWIISYPYLLIIAALKISEVLWLAPAITQSKSSLSNANTDKFKSKSDLEDLDPSKKIEDKSDEVSEAEKEPKTPQINEEQEQEE